MDEGIIVAILALVIVGLPMMGLTARFALKPIVEAIIRLREAFSPATGAQIGLQERRLAAVEAELAAVRGQLERLESTAFVKELRSAPSGSAQEALSAPARPSEG